MTMYAPDIFTTVPKTRYLSIYNKNGSFDPQEISKFLRFRKKDVSTACNLPLASIRYDAPRAPQELLNRIKEWGVALEKVAEHFEGDQEKTALWFSIENPMLGYIAPRDMIRFGRFKKLYKFILSALEENKR